MLFNALPPLGMRCCRVCLLLSHASLTVKCASVCTHVFNHHANKYYLQSVVYFDMPSRHQRPISRAHLNVSLCMCAFNTFVFVTLVPSGFWFYQQHFAVLRIHKHTRVSAAFLTWLTDDEWEIHACGAACHIFSALRVSENGSILLKENAMNVSGLWLHFS